MQIKGKLRLYLFLSKFIPYFERMRNDTILHAITDIVKKQLSMHKLYTSIKISNELTVANNNTNHHTIDYTLSFEGLDFHFRLLYENGKTKDKIIYPTKAMDFDEAIKLHSIHNCLSQMPKEDINTLFSYFSINN